MSSASRPLEGLHLLVIEDEQDIRELITLMLEIGGATVTTVVHIYEALEALDRFIPDALLSNIHLPDGDGFMMMELWRNKEAELGIKPIPAVIILDSPREVNRDRIHQSGFQTYLSKPFNVDKVIETVAKTIAELEQDLQSEPD